MPSTRAAIGISKKDKVPNFWLKNLISIHHDLANAYTNVIENLGEILTWLTQGITYLLPKSEDTKDVKNLAAYYLPSKNVQDSNTSHYRKNVQLPS